VEDFRVSRETRAWVWGRIKELEGEDKNDDMNDETDGEGDADENGEEDDPRIRLRRASS
jgi:hypothetical protein